MPGVAELQSLVTMEAMASGLPVIGADAVALPHLITNGENGYLFRPGNSQDLARKLEKVLKDEKLRVRMGQNSLKLIQAHDMKKIMEQVESVYRKVLRDHKLNGHDVSEEKGIEIDELIYQGFKKLRDVI